MFYTSTQAAKYLGISGHSLKKLVDAGVLKDHGVTKPGATKHELRLQLSELKAYKKEHKLAAKPKSRIPNPSILNSPGMGILARLDRIETKLDDLLKIWS